MTKLKATATGASIGAVLRKEVMSRVELEKGGALVSTESSDGCRITPHDPEIERRMEAVRKVVSTRRTVLRELAE